MKRVMFALSILCLCSVAVRAGQDEKASDAAIKEAIAILEARLAQAEKQDDKDKIAKAIGELEKLMPKTKKDGGEKVEPSKLTPAVLAKKFAGKAAVNPKTGELTLVYDLKNSTQLKDFDAKDGKPTAKGGILKIGPGEELEHLVKFESATLTGVVTIGNVDKDDILIAASGQASIRYAGDYNNSECLIRVWSAGKVLATKNQFLNTPVRAIPIRFEVSGKKVLATIKGAALGGTTQIEGAGRFTLRGGSGGVLFASLVIAGVPDKEWLNEFLKK